MKDSLIYRFVNLAGPQGSAICVYSYEINRFRGLQDSCDTRGYAYKADTRALQERQDPREGFFLSADVIPLFHG